MKANKRILWMLLALVGMAAMVSCSNDDEDSFMAESDAKEDATMPVGSVIELDAFTSSATKGNIVGRWKQTATVLSRFDWNVNKDVDFSRGNFISVPIADDVIREFRTDGICIETTNGKVTGQWEYSYDGKLYWGLNHYDRLKYFFYGDEWLQGACYFKDDGKTMMQTLHPYYGITSPFGCSVTWLDTRLFERIK